MASPCGLAVVGIRHRTTLWALTYIIPKYAAFASHFTPQTLGERHAAYLTAAGDDLVSPEHAREQLEEHAGGELDPDLPR